MFIIYNTKQLILQHTEYSKARKITKQSKKNNEEFQNAQKNIPFHWEPKL